MVDVVRRFAVADRGEVELLLHLHCVHADFRGEPLQLLGGNNAAAPDADQLAGGDVLPGDDGLAACNVTISDFAFVGEVSRTVLAHETSASARRAVRFAV